MGSVLGFAIINGPIAFLGKASVHVFPRELILNVSGVLFLVFGIFLFLRKDFCEMPPDECTEKGISDARENGKVPGRKNGFIPSLGMILVAELGDKTQFGTLILAARFGKFWPVYAGVILALALSSLVGIVFGKKICSALPPKALSYLSSFVFILLGIYTLCFKP